VSTPGHRRAKSHRSPRARASWARPSRLLAILVPVLLVVLGIGIFAAVGGGGKRAGGHPAGPASPREAAVTRGGKWLTGRATQLLAAVNADQGQLSTAERAGRHQDAQSVGAQLARDARAALDGPTPPAHARLYTSGLKVLERAGSDAANDNFSEVARLLLVGNSEIAKVVATLNYPVPASRSAVVNDPND
jgi:hypothetical protein